MANTLVSLRISKDLLESSKSLAKADGYISLQEFMRDAIRKRIQEHEISQLEKLRGIAKGKKLKSKADWEDEVKRLYFSGT